MRVYSAIMISLACLLAACTVSNIQVAKAGHLCESKGAAIDKMGNTLNIVTVTCTDGKTYNVDVYNPHEGP